MPPPAGPPPYHIQNGKQLAFEHIPVGRGSATPPLDRHTPFEHDISHTGAPIRLGGVSVDEQVILHYPVLVTNVVHDDRLHLAASYVDVQYYDHLLVRSQPSRDDIPVVPFISYTAMQRKCRARAVIDEPRVTPLPQVLSLNMHRHCTRLSQHNIVGQHDGCPKQRSNGIVDGVLNLLHIVTTLQ